MPAAYDKYDYPSYWVSRAYEHGSEVIAINAFLEKIKKIRNILEIGAGFGRLSPTYLYRAKKVILSDPSARLLKIARNEITNKKVVFLQSKVENLRKKVKGKSLDLIIMVRVLHHIQNPEKAFFIINKLLKKNSYLILEFPNKTHFKANISEFLHGNFTFPIDIFPKDLCKKRKKTLPFVNYHPDTIRESLETYGFQIIETRSVSNIRNPFIKKFFPLDTCLFIEKYLQKPLSTIRFGPSIFILAKKRD